MPQPNKKAANVDGKRECQVRRLETFAVRPVCKLTERQPKGLHLPAPDCRERKPETEEAKKRCLVSHGLT